jgi:hypothetical protein
MQLNKLLEEIRAGIADLDDENIYEPTDSLISPVIDNTCQKKPEYMFMAPVEVDLSPTHL